MTAWTHPLGTTAAPHKVAIFDHFRKTSKKKLVTHTEREISVLTVQRNEGTKKKTNK